MEETGGQNRARVTVIDDIREMLQRAGTAAGDDGNRNRVAHCPSQRAIEAGSRPIGVHAGQKDFACTELHGAAGPLNGIQIRGMATPMGVDTPGFSVGFAFRVDRNDYTLGTKTIGGFTDQVGVPDGGGVERDFVCAGPQHRFDVGDCSKTAAYRERHETLLCRRGDDIVHDPPLVAGSGDVEENEFVGTLCVVGFGRLHRIAGVAKVLKFHAFDHPSGSDVQTGNDTATKHSGTSNRQ